MTTALDEETRRRAARAIAGASTAELAARWAAWPNPPVAEYIRGPEAGHVMVQARIGGGDRFNLGEATVSRATVLLRGGGLVGERLGTSYVLGSDVERAGIAAIFDALLTDDGQRPRVLAEVVEPLALAQRERDTLQREQARSTVVDFFTVARENDAPAVNDEEIEEEGDQ